MHKLWFMSTLHIVSSAEFFSQMPAKTKIYKSLLNNNKRDKLQNLFFRTHQSEVTFLFIPPGFTKTGNFINFSLKDSLPREILQSVYGILTSSVHSNTLYCSTIFPWCLVKACLENKNQPKSPCKTVTLILSS